MRRSAMMSRAQQGYVRHDAAHIFGEHVFLDLPHVPTNLVENREHVIHQAIQDAVEQPARPFSHVALGKGLILLATGEEGLQRLEPAIVHHDQEVGANEEIDLAGRTDAPLVVEYGEMHHDEEIVLVLVDFGALALAQHVVEVQRVKAEPAPQHIDVLRRRVFDVHPGYVVIG